MNHEITTQILDRITKTVEAEEQFTIKLLQCDKWLASSILQKSIRRGDQKTAARAAITFWRLDKISFWRRISVICTEDCGAALDEITQTLTAFNNPAWRNKTGDLKVGLYLVRILCQSVKLRLADEIYSIAAQAHELKKQRDTLAQAGNTYLADIVLDRKYPLEDRALSLWMLAGSKRYQHDDMPERAGCLEWAAEILMALNAPAGLTHACITNLTKTRWPLSLFMPLLAAETARQPKPLLISYDKFPSSSNVKGVPLVALDGFTRTGKAAFLEFRKEVPDLKMFTPRQIALGAFFTQGYCVDKRLTSEWLQSIRQSGEIADMEAAGLDLPRHMALREIMTEYADKLENIREKHVRSYFDRRQHDFFGEDE